MAFLLDFDEGMKDEYSNVVFLLGFLYTGVFIKAYNPF